MTISAKVIEHSQSPSGIDLITLQLQYPRFIHAEFLTHRVFSRNASSSRAIPIEKSIELIKQDIAMPIHWGLNQPGMQATKHVDLDKAEKATRIWNDAAKLAIEKAEELMRLGIHKQVVNRILEPFSHISVIVTSTEWENFFNLRIDSGAQPMTQALAVEMLKVIHQSTPRVVPIKIAYSEGWHLPYVTEEERSSYSIDILPKISAARCARVSYLTHDGAMPDVEKDIALFDKLVKSKPVHASPVEHQAYPLPDDRFCKNFRGWMQYRAIIEKAIINGVDF